MKPQTIADRLGDIKAKIAELRDKESELKDELIESGVDSAEGKLFRVTVTHHVVTNVDYRGLMEKLSPPKRLVRSFTTEMDRTQVRVSAR